MEFEKELTIYSKELLAKAMKYCSSEADAFDLLQDTYIRALKYRHQFQMGTNLRAWLYTIMHNTFVNGYRRTQRKNSYLEEAKHVLQEKRVPTADDTVVGRREFEVLLRKLEDTLSEPFFKVLVLCDLKDKSYKEAADILGCPVGTVMSRLHRARKYSRKFLLENYDHDFLEEFIPVVTLDEVWDREIAA